MLLYKVGKKLELKRQQQGSMFQDIEEVDELARYLEDDVNVIYYSIQQECN